MAFGDKRSTKKVQEAPVKKTIEINAEMNGTIAFKDPVDLKINGFCSGSLDVRGTLTIGSKAKVEADVVGDNIVIAGAVKGTVKASNLLTLMPTAVLEGDIFTPKLNIVEGAIFQGVCHMTPTDQKEWLNVAEVSAYLELDENAILDLVRNQKIPCVQEGDTLKFERAQIDQWTSSAMVQ